MTTTQPSTFTIKINNPSLDNNPRTALTTDYASGVTSLVVISKVGFTKVDRGNPTYFYVMVEDYGYKRADIVKVTADDTDNRTLTVAATSNSHSASDPVTFIPYDQIRIYGATTTGGTKVLIATIGIDTSQQTTSYTYEGTTYAFFYTAYYNSSDDEISAYSDEIISTTYGRTSARRVIDSALRKAMTVLDESAGSRLNVAAALEVLNDGLDEIVQRHKKWPFLHTISTGTNTTSGTAYISKPTDLSKLDLLIVNNQEIHFITKKTYDDYVHCGATVSNGQPYSYTIKDDKFYLYPTPSGTYAIQYEYYKYPTEINALTDDVDRPFSAILIYYMASQFAYIKGNDKRGDKLYIMYQKLLEQQVEEYTGAEQTGTAEPIELTNSVNFDEEPTY